MGYGEHLNAGRYSAILVIVFSVILTILLGIWIW
jgi:succinate dehydrogenase / fumarate reductase cytochrome b subunit